MQTSEPRQLSEIEAALTHGTVIRMEQVQHNDRPRYIVLRKHGAGFCTHFYNPDLDAFEFGTYHQELHPANIKYHARLAEYGVLQF